MVIFGMYIYVPVRLVFYCYFYYLGFCYNFEFNFTYQTKATQEKVQ